MVKNMVDMIEEGLWNMHITIFWIIQWLIINEFMTVNDYDFITQ